MSVCIMQVVPWYIRLWLHTLRLTVDGQVRKFLGGVVGRGRGGGGPGMHLEGLLRVISVLAERQSSLSIMVWLLAHSAAVPGWSDGHLEVVSGQLGTGRLEVL
jgi:hypothetical protein